MIIDGKTIANSVYEKLALAIAKFPHPPALDIIIVGDDPVIENFVRIKKKAAVSLGISMFEHRFAVTVEEKVLIEEVKRIGKKVDTNGLIVQLPLPEKINTQLVLDAIPIEKDIDMLSTQSMALFSQGEAKIIPPVAGAVKEILDYARVSVSGKEVLVLGYGRLVGIPVSILMRHNGAHVTVIDKPISNLKEHVKDSTVVISGTGQSCLITPDMITKETILIDAGTSESGGKIVGDVDPHCVEVAQVFTPVPGGVGPVTVAMLFKNLCVLAREYKK